MRVPVDVQAVVGQEPQPALEGVGVLVDHVVGGQLVEARRGAFEAQNIGLIPGGTGSPAQRVDAARAELSQIDSQLVSAQAQLAASLGRAGRGQRGLG